MLHVLPMYLFISVIYVSLTVQQMCIQINISLFYERSASHIIITQQTRYTDPMVGQITVFAGYARQCSY